MERSGIGAILSDKLERFLLRTMATTDVATARMVADMLHPMHMVAMTIYPNSAISFRHLKPTFPSITQYSKGYGLWIIYAQQE